MKETLPPERAQLARHILEGLRLAREQKDEMTEYLLEMALKEVLGHAAGARAAILDRLPDHD